MENREKIAELVRKVQKENDLSAKNELLEKYLECGCKWAHKKVKNIVYTNLISPSNSEILSMVYQSFEKTIKTIKTDDVRNMSFKNYFHLMIRYQIFLELKTTLNCQVVEKYQEHVNQLNREMKQQRDECGEQIRQLIINHAMWEIVNYLEGKNINYSRTIILKSQGYKNKEICEILNISEMSLKSQIQYIKKLIRGKFHFPLLDS